MRHPLLIVGASARAAAFSALRAGLEPVCADLFADLDLASRCPATRIAGADYPYAFRKVVAGWPGPWMYTGALENHRLLVAELARLRPLWGNDEEALNPSRMPELWTQVLQNAGLPCPRIRLPGDMAQQQPAGRWLVKPLKSAGGSGIRFWNGEGLAGGSAFHQEYIGGVSCSAVFLGRQRQARLLGATLQLIGEDWLHAGPFRYCGSIGPLPVSGHLARLGQVLAAGCGIQGLFGVDCVWDEDGMFWPVEINPRYTASVEVLEYACGLPALALHRSAFDESCPESDVPESTLDRVVGKAILFARQDLAFPPEGPWLTALGPRDPWQMPPLADIPPAGTPIRRGQPVLTILAAATDVKACRDQLRLRAAELDRMLFG